MIPMQFPKSVVIREVGPREGFQTSNVVIATEKKLELISLLNQCGLTSIEVTSFVRPDRVPQMADAIDVAKRFEKKEGIKYRALYLNTHGFAQAEDVGRFENDGWLYAAASDEFLKRNNNTSLHGVIEGIPGWIKIFSDAGKSLHGLMLSTAFGCSYIGAINDKKFVEVLSQLHRGLESSGASLKEICLADTVGWADPEQIKARVQKTREIFPAADVSLHLHNTRGLGIANAYAGLTEGVRIFESSVGGMGGCPFAPGAAGNIATEELVYLCDRLGIKTGVSVDACVRAARFAEVLLGRSLYGTLFRGWK